MVKIEEYLIHHSIIKTLRDHGRPFRKAACSLLIQIQKYPNIRVYGFEIR